MALAGWHSGKTMVIFTTGDVHGQIDSLFVPNKQGRKNSYDANITVELTVKLAKVGIRIEFESYQFGPNPYSTAPHRYYPYYGELPIALLAHLVWCAMSGAGMGKSGRYWRVCSIPVPSDSEVAARVAGDIIMTYSNVKFVSATREWRIRYHLATMPDIILTDLEIDGVKLKISPRLRHRFIKPFPEQNDGAIHVTLLPLP